MIYFAYRIFLFPLAYILLRLLRPFLNGKTKEMIQDKDLSHFIVNRGTSDSIARQRPFWIHAASGEIEYARAVIRALKKEFPEIPILVTHSSPSAKKILKNMSEVDAWGPLPWDCEKNCTLFLEKWQPRCFLIARTDVWPSVATVCRSREIPSLLFAATFAENSSRLKGISGAINQHTLNQLDQIHCVSKDDETQLRRLNITTPVAVTGDTRFDQVLHRLQHPKALKTFLRPERNAVLIAGSTWPEDEKILIPAYAAIKDSYRLILAPHEIQNDHLLLIENLLQSYQIASCRYSQAKSWDYREKNHQVLLIDEIGILAELYTWGTVGFVGGSFKKQIHSVMEPLAAGLPVLVGPLHHNNREALHFKNIQVAGVKVVEEVIDSASLQKSLVSLAEHHDLLNFRQGLEGLIKNQGTATADVTDWCRRNKQVSQSET